MLEIKNKLISLTKKFISLTKKSFFCIPVKENKIPFFTSKEKIAKGYKANYPAQQESQRRQITAEEYATFFEREDWKEEVHGIAICGGHNGTVVFDFDIKGLEGEEIEHAWEFWISFKEFLQRLIPGNFYVEKSPSGGEHIIFLISNIGSSGYINFNKFILNNPSLGMLGGKAFVELIGFYRGNDGLNKVTAAKYVHIAPTPNYKKISEVELEDLTPVSPDVFTHSLDYFDRSDYCKKEELVNEPLISSNTHITGIPLNDLITETKRRLDTVIELERLGYKKKSSCGTETRMIAPGSKTGNPGITVRSDGKFFSHHAGDQWSDGKGHDVIDIIMHNNGGDWNRTIQEMESITGLVRRKKTEEIKVEIQREARMDAQREKQEEIKKASQDNFTINKVIRVEEKEELYFITKKNGKEIVVSNKDLTNVALDAFGGLHFKEYYSTKNGFKNLKKSIFAATEGIDPIEGFQYAKWRDEKFMYKSTDTLHIQNEYAEKKGTLEEWQTEIGNKCDCYGLQFPLTLACAAPLASEVHKILFGINLWGRSGVGKTTAARVLNSMTQSNSSIEHCQATMAGLQISIAEAQGKVIIADELTGSDKLFMENLGAILAINGKRRGAWVNGKVTKSTMPSSTSLLLTTSENPSQEYFAKHGVKRNEGMKNRFLDVEILREDFPAFEYDSDFNDFLGGLSEATERLHGTAIEAFLDSLPPLSVLKKRYASFKSKSTSNRSAQHFEFLKFVGELMNESGIFPEHFDFTEAVSHFASRVKNIDKGSQELILKDEIIEHISHLLTSPNHAALNNDLQRPPKDCFIYTNSGVGVNEYFLHLDPLYRYVSEQYGCKKQQFKKILVDAGLIKLKSKDVTLRYTGMRVKLYEFDLDNLNRIIDAEDPDLDPDDITNYSPSDPIVETDVHTLNEPAPDSQLVLEQTLKLLVDPENSIVNDTIESVCRLPIVIRPAPEGSKDSSVTGNRIFLCLDNLTRKVNESMRCRKEDVKNALYGVDLISERYTYLKIRPLNRFESVVDLNLEGVCSLVQESLLEVE